MNLREKVTRLESVRSITDEKLFRLVRAADTYTDLLARRPVFDDTTATDSDSLVDPNRVPKDDLLEDDGKRWSLMSCIFYLIVMQVLISGVRYAFNRLIQRVSHLEGSSGHRSSKRSYADHATSVQSLSECFNFSVRYRLIISFFAFRPASWSGIQLPPVSNFAFVQQRPTDLRYRAFTRHRIGSYLIATPNRWHRSAWSPQ